MREFVDGEGYYESFRARSGWMGFLADASIENSAVILSNIDFKPMHTKNLIVTVGEIFSFASRLVAKAKRQGYTAVILKGVRMSGKNPNRPIRYTRRTG